jgi:polyphenol oxidase
MNKPVLHVRQANCLRDVKGVAHGFFGRAGGVSKGIYEGLNCGLGSNDDRANVLENRARVAHYLGATTPTVLTCYQIHSATAIVVDAPWAPDAQPRADAVVTRTRGLAIGALAADCAPIIFADPVAGVVAAAHAGWRGALDGIVEATVTAMETLGSQRGNILAAVGPCIAHTAYEVGPEFKGRFTSTSDRNKDYFSALLVGGRDHFDLPRFVADKLAEAGCKTYERSDRCTYANSADYFSFRRTTHLGEDDYGRQISAIMLTEL